MPRESAANTSGPVSRAICVFQEKWVLHIVHTLLDGPRGFNELGRDVGGCNPSTLNQRLARLEELGLIHRHSECQGARSAYALTEAGEALREVITAIRAWSASYLTEDGVAHGVVVDVPAARAAAHDATHEPVHEQALEPVHESEHEQGREPVHEARPDRAHEPVRPPNRLAPHEPAREPGPPAPIAAAGTLRAVPGQKRLRAVEDGSDVRPPRVEVH